MQTALHKFTMLIERNRQLASSVHLLKSQITVDIDFSDIYRTQVVAAFSALDFLVHETVKIGILEQFDGKREKSNGYNDFVSNLNMPTNLCSKNEQRSWLEAETSRIHSWKSFQQSKKISDALKKVVNPESFWNTIAIAFKTTSELVKKDLDIKVKRRNQIAHEGDINPTYGLLWDISSADSEMIVDFVEKFGTEMIKILM